MPIEVLNQRDYLLTEVSLRPPIDPERLVAIDRLIRESGDSGRMIALYSDGAITALNVEQKTKVREGVVDRVREMIGVADAEVNGNVNGHHR